MDPQRKQTILKILQQNDGEGVSFFDTKEALLRQGYTPHEITLCLYQFPYDGVPNAPKPEDPLRKYFEKHPDRAEYYALSRMQMDEQADLDRATQATLMSGINGGYRFNARANYFAASALGLPYFKILFVGICLLVACIALKVSDLTERIVLGGYGALIAIWHIYAIMNMRASVHLLQDRINELKAPKDTNQP